MRTLIVAALLLFSPAAWSATCKISEYGGTGADSGGRQIQVAVEPAIAVQEVTYTSSTQSAAFNSQTKFIRIVCDAKAHFEFGTNPTAAATDPYVTADTAEYFAVLPGYEVAFYDGTT